MKNGLQFLTPHIVVDIPLNFIFSIEYREQEW